MIRCKAITAAVNKIKLHKMGQITSLILNKGFYRCILMELNMRASHGTLLPLFLHSMMKPENKPINVIMIIAIFMEPLQFPIPFTRSHSFIRLEGMQVMFRVFKTQMCNALESTVVSLTR